MRESAEVEKGTRTHLLLQFMLSDGRRSSIIVDAARKGKKVSVNVEARIFFLV